MGSLFSKRLFVLMVLFLGATFLPPARAALVEAKFFPHMVKAPLDNHSWVLLRLEIEPGWHVYWQNPGDSGEPVSIRWDLPSTVSASAIHWPAPKRIPMGPLVNFGYEDSVDLLIQLKASQPVNSLKATADIRWLVCKEECIPEKTKQNLTFRRVSSDRNIEKAIQVLPKPLPQDWKITATEDSGAIVLEASVPNSVPSYQQVAFFPQTEGQFQNPSLFSSNFPLRLTRSQSSPLAQVEGLLSFETENQTIAYEITVPIQKPVTSGWLAMLYAFLGGILLNLMPCVFPVLSLKLVSFLNQPVGSRLRDSLAYSLGILLSFILLAVTLIVFREGGQGLGWGFHLQSPLLVALLGLLFFVLGLSFLDVVTFPSRWANVGSQLANKKGMLGSFFTGVLATIVATPCTAPFMGVAIGVALTQPVFIAIAIFAFLGLGMAFPYLLASLVPAISNRLPKPGAWMELLKESMAFPLFATSAWLLYLLAQLVSIGALFQVLLAMVGISFAAWLWRRFSARPIKIACTLLIGLSLYFSLPKTAESDSNWLSYSEQSWQEMKASPSPYFVNFTADWCLSCKVNERLVLSQKDIQEAMNAKGVQRLKVDWTQRNESIGRLLQQFGRAGVPLYLFFRQGTDSNPTILPQILTKERLLEELDQL